MIPRLPLRTAHDLDLAINALGVIPFFGGTLKGLSVQALADPALWFADGVDGPWQWKGPVIGMGHAAYGKFLAGKAVYMRLDAYADFLNYRRWCMTMSTQGEARLGGLSERGLLRIIEEAGSLVSSELKEMLGMGRRHARRADELVDVLALDSTAPRSSMCSSLDRMLTRLQMAGRLCIENFEYPVAASGHHYGWGLARYTTPEALYGEEILQCQDRTPLESRARLAEMLIKAAPEASARHIHTLLG